MLSFALPSATTRLAATPSPHLRLSPPKPSPSVSPPRLVHFNHETRLRFRRLAAAAAAADAAGAPSDSFDIDEEDEQEEKKEEWQVKVPEMEQPLLMLKFIWMEKNIGIALDRLIPGKGSIPLSPYYFWPRKDAWEELRAKLEEKEWISQKQMIILLNQATDIINLWQQGGGSLST